MKLSEVGEFAFIERLRGKLRAGAGMDRRTILGIGDDAAVRRAAGPFEVWTTDTLVAGIHFPASPSWRDLGWKALAVNVSDVAAMGGTPDAALVTLALPPDFELENGLELYRGIDEACAAFGAVVAGGDVVRAPVAVITVALSGYARADEHGQPLLLRRDAARPGDAVAVTSSLGAAVGGVRVLLGADVDDPEGRERLLAAQQRPQPRVREGQAAVEEGVRCAIDLSDGLMADLGHVCEMSGVAATVRADSLPVDPWLARAFPADALALAAAGGEDYELLLAAPEERLQAVRRRIDTPLTIVGEIREGTPGEVRLLDAGGRDVSLPAAGWDHFGGGAGDPPLP